MKDETPHPTDFEISKTSSFRFNLDVKQLILGPSRRVGSMPKQWENIVICRLWTMQCCTASMLAIIFATSSIAADSPKGWERFEFVGNTVFSDNQLRTALVAEPDFLLAAHPSSDRATVRPIAERLLFAGYRNSGFPSPQIEFQVADHGGGTVTIHEGPRFRCGQRPGSDKRSRTKDICIDQDLELPPTQLPPSVRTVAMSYSPITRPRTPKLDSIS